MKLPKRILVVDDSKATLEIVRRSLEGFGYRHLSIKKTNYRLYPYAGIRIQDIDIQTELNRLDFKKEVTPVWIEPIVGIRNELVLKRWKFILNGDLGFLGSKDKISYMINFNTYFRISNLISVKAGWTDWDTNYEDNVKGEDLTLYIHLSGPSAAISFHF